jgi:glycosyltransferase involved in cell wall biosynthesis
MSTVDRSALVSVVIPCRNAAAWLSETLESVLTQERVDLEVIVVDDGSDDESVRIARAAGPRVTVIAQAPLGVSAARNAGTRAARGAFLQYLDADDVLTPGTLAARVTLLDDSGADVALAPWTRWERTGDVFVDTRTERRVMGHRPDVELLTDAWWPPGAVLYRRSIVERIGPWRTDLPIIQDARFLLDAALNGAAFVYVDAVGLKYRVLDGSLSRRDPAAFLDDCYRSAADLHDRWLRDGGLDDERRRALVRVYAHVARPFYATDRARFADAFARITALDPAFRPEGPASLRALSGLVGYPTAERLALWWRQVKKAVHAGPLVRPSGPTMEVSEPPVRRSGPTASLSR